MKFNWIYYLDLAQELFDQRDKLGRKEPCLRSSISRAYYAAFNYAYGYAVSQGARISDDQKHVQVINWFEQAQKLDRKLKQIGLDLREMRKQRNIADYQDEFPNGLKGLEPKAKEILICSRRVLSNIESMTER